MTIRLATRWFSTALLVLAVALVGYGLFGLSRFVWYTGTYFDDRLVLFDNGFYPFMWGAALLIVGQLLRLRHWRLAMVIAMGSALALFVWKRVTVPANGAGQALFPDVELLNELIVISTMLLALVRVDQLIRQVLMRIRCTLWRGK